MILSGRDLQLYIETGKLVIQPVQPEQFQQNGVDLVIESAELQWEHFWLGCTREHLELPDDLMAFVEIRSTWARRGFFLPPTIVDAGFKGNLTLEILVMGRMDPYGLQRTVPPVGERFAHLIFAKTSGPCQPYSGKYQGQSGITGPKE